MKQLRRYPILVLLAALVAWPACSDDDGDPTPDARVYPDAWVGPDAATHDAAPPDAATDATVDPDGGTNLGPERSCDTVFRYEPATSVTSTSCAP